MKILVYSLIAVFFTSSLTAYAVTPIVDTPKKEMIEAQQQETQKAMEAVDAAEPEAEARPAATASQKKHSEQSNKADMIKKQKKATHQSIKDAEAARPDAEARPAATTNQK
jgi:hypothetical protein